MADKKLESITFPDLPDRYVVKPDIADVTGLQTALDDKANIDGTYDNMTVGNAEQLHSTVGATDTEPFSFRTSGGSLNIGDREELTLVGVDVGWNQLVQNGDFADGTTGWLSSGTLTVSNGVATISKAGASNEYIDLSITTARSSQFIANHRYLVSVVIKSDNRIGIYPGGGSAQGGLYYSSAGEYSSKKTLAFIWSPPGSGNIAFGVRAYTGASVSVDLLATFENAMCIDLTQLLGSTIADYIYTLETANAGAGVAFFNKYFGNGYKAYDGGSLQSPVVKGIKMTGFNQWDEEWELGKYSVSTGNKSSANDQIRSKNKIRIIPNTQYFFQFSSGTMNGVYFYDANENYLGSDSAIGISTPSVKTTPANAYYMTFQMSNAYGTTYNNDICINLHWDGERDGEYEPYEEHYYPISPEALHGVMTIEDGKLKADGDIRHADGTIDRWFTYRNYQSGDESLADAITDGVHTTVKKQTPTTDTADPFTTPMIVDDWGTEEFIYNDGTTKFVPVGHSTKYLPNLKAKLEMSPDSPSGDGVYVVEQVSGINTYIPLASADTITSIITRIEALENA